jgi:hypothetical protein
VEVGWPLDRVEKMGKGKLKYGVTAFVLPSDLGGDSPEAPKDQVTSATRPLPRDRQRSSTASQKGACNTGQVGRTGRKDRADDRCFIFAGRQTVSTPTRDLNVVFLDPSQELTKALPRHLSVHKTPVISLRTGPGQRHSLPATSSRSSRELALRGNPTGG